MVTSADRVVLNRRKDADIAALLQARITRVDHEKFSARQ